MWIILSLLSNASFTHSIDLNKILKIIIKTNLFNVYGLIKTYPCTRSLEMFWHRWEDNIKFIINKWMSI
jgi:hypothetical protein